MTLSSAAPRASAHACGMRTIGAKFLTPYAPRLLTVKVPVATWTKNEVYHIGGGISV